MKRLPFPLCMLIAVVCGQLPIALAFLLHALHPDPRYLMLYRVHSALVFLTLFVSVCWAYRIWRRRPE